MPYRRRSESSGLGCFAFAVVSPLILGVIGFLTFPDSPKGPPTPPPPRFPATLDLPMDPPASPPLTFPTPLDVPTFSIAPGLRCRDGWVSSSHGRGTCSHHGGIGG